MNQGGYDYCECEKRRLEEERQERERQKSRKRFARMSSREGEAELLAILLCKRIQETPIKDLEKTIMDTVTLFGKDFKRFCDRYREEM